MINNTYNYDNLKEQVKKELKESITEGGKEALAESLIEIMSQKLNVKNIKFDTKELTKYIEDQISDAISGVKINKSIKNVKGIRLDEFIDLNDEDLKKQIQVINDKLIETGELLDAKQLLGGLLVAKNRKIDFSEIFNEKEFQDFIKEYQFDAELIQNITSEIENYKPQNKKFFNDFISSLDELYSARKKIEDFSELFDLLKSYMAEQPAGTRANKFWEHLSNDFNNLDDKTKNLLEDLKLLNREKDGITAINSGANNKGGIIGDENVVLTRSITDQTSPEKTLALKKALEEASAAGVNCSKIIDVIHDKESDLFLEIQKTVKGSSISTIGDEIDSINKDVFSASDDQIQKLISDLKTLYNLGLEPDVENLSNILYDSKKGFSFIDLDLHESEAQSSFSSFEEMLEAFINTLRYQVDDINEYLKAPEDAKSWENFTNQVVSAAEQLTKEAQNATQKAQDSHSPSKVAEALGGDWGKGYANGILKSKKEVENAVIQLIKAGKITVSDLIDDSANINSEEKYKGLAEAVNPLIDLFSKGASVDNVIGSNLKDSMMQFQDEVKKSNAYLQDGNDLLEERAALISNGNIVKEFSQQDEKGTVNIGAFGDEIDTVMHSHPFNELEDHLRFSDKDIVNLVDGSIKKAILQCGEEFMTLDMTNVSDFDSLKNNILDMYKGVLVKFGAQISKDSETGAFKVAGIDTLPSEIQNEAVNVINSLMSGIVNKYGGQVLFDKIDNGKLVDNDDSRISRITDDDIVSAQKYIDIVTSNDPISALQKYQDEINKTGKEFDKLEQKAKKTKVDLSNVFLDEEDNAAPYLKDGKVKIDSSKVNRYVAGSNNAFEKSAEDIINAEHAVSDFSEEIDESEEKIETISYQGLSQDISDIANKSEKTTDDIKVLIDALEELRDLSDKEGILYSENDQQNIISDISYLIDKISEFNGMSPIIPENYLDAVEIFRGDLEKINKSGISSGTQSPISEIPEQAKEAESSIDSLTSALLNLFKIYQANKDNTEFSFMANSITGENSLIHGSDEKFIDDKEIGNQIKSMKDVPNIFGHTHPENDIASFAAEDLRSFVYWYKNTFGKLNQFFVIANKEFSTLDFSKIPEDKLSEFENITNEEIEKTVYETVESLTSLENIKNSIDNGSSLFGKNLNFSKENFGKTEINDDQYSQVNAIISDVNKEIPSLLNEVSDISELKNKIRLSLANKLKESNLSDAQKPVVTKFFNDFIREQISASLPNYDYQSELRNCIKAMLDKILKDTGMIANDVYKTFPINQLSQYIPSINTVQPNKSEISFSDLSIEDKAKAIEDAILELETKTGKSLAKVVNNWNSLDETIKKDATDILSKVGLVNENQELMFHIAGEGSNTKGNTGIAIITDEFAILQKQTDLSTQELEQYLSIINQLRSAGVNVANVFSAFNSTLGEQGKKGTFSPGYEIQERMNGSIAGTPIRSVSMENADTAKKRVEELTRVLDLSDEQLLKFISDFEQVAKVLSSDPSNSGNFILNNSGVGMIDMGYVRNKNSNVSNSEILSGVFGSLLNAKGLSGAIDVSPQIQDVVNKVALRIANAAEQSGKFTRDEILEKISTINEKAGNFVSANFSQSNKNGISSSNDPYQLSNAIWEYRRATKYDKNSELQEIVENQASTKDMVRQPGMNGMFYKGGIFDRNIDFSDKTSIYDNIYGTANSSIGTEWFNKLITLSGNELPKILELFKQARDGVISWNEANNSAISILDKRLELETEVASFKNKKSSQPNKTNNSSTTPLIEEDAIVQDQDKIQENLEETDKAVQKVLYHYGLLNSYQGGRKSHQFGDEIQAYVEGINNGGRGWADGTGTYVTDEYKSLPSTSSDFNKYFAIDPSKIKMYEAHTEEEAKALYEFQHKLEEFVLASGSGFKGFDENLQGVDANSLFSEAKTIFAKYPGLFDSVFSDFESFEKFLNEMTELVKKSGLQSDGSFNAKQLFDFKKENGVDDIKTRFMKKLGFGGTDNSGTSYGGIKSGSVIYDIDTAPIIASGDKIIDVLQNVQDEAIDTKEAIDNISQSNKVETPSSNLIYHMGNLDDLSKTHKGETLGKHNRGSSGVGTLGTGTYGVSKNSLSSIENFHPNGSYYAIDTSKYNLYVADTNEKLMNLGGVLEDFEHAVMSVNKIDFIDEDSFREIDVNELYNNCKNVFEGFENTFKTVDDFKLYISELQNNFSKLGLNELHEFENASDEDLKSDSLSTRLMKKLGYQGVNTTGSDGDRAADGTVIYDLDPSTIVGKYTTIADAAQNTNNIISTLNNTIAATPVEDQGINIAPTDESIEEINSGLESIKDESEDVGESITDSILGALKEVTAEVDSSSIETKLEETVQPDISAIDYTEDHYDTLYSKLVKIRELSESFSIFEPEDIDESSLRELESTLFSLSETDLEAIGIDPKKINGLLDNLEIVKERLKEQTWQFEDNIYDDESYIPEYDISPFSDEANEAKEAVLLAKDTTDKAGISVDRLISKIETLDLSKYKTEVDEVTEAESRAREAKRAEIKKGLEEAAQRRKAAKEAQAAAEKELAENAKKSESIQENINLQKEDQTGTEGTANTVVDSTEKEISEYQKLKQEIIECREEINKLNQLDSDSKSLKIPKYVGQTYEDKIKKYTALSSEDFDAKVAEKKNEGVTIGDKHQFNVDISSIVALIDVAKEKGKNLNFNDFFGEDTKELEKISLYYSKIVSYIRSLNDTSYVDDIPQKLAVATQKLSLLESKLKEVVKTASVTDQLEYNLTNIFNEIEHSKGQVSKDQASSIIKQFTKFKITDPSTISSITKQLTSNESIIEAVNEQLGLMAEKEKRAKVAALKAALERRSAAKVSTDAIKEETAAVDDLTNEYTVNKPSEIPSELESLRQRYKELSEEWHSFTKGTVDDSTSDRFVAVKTELEEIRSRLIELNQVYNGTEWVDENLYSTPSAPSSPVVQGGIENAAYMSEESRIAGGLTQVVNEITNAVKLKTEEFERERDTVSSVVSDEIDNLHLLIEVLSEVQAEVYYISQSFESVSLDKANIGNDAFKQLAEYLKQFAEDVKDVKFNEEFIKQLNELLKNADKIKTAANAVKQGINSNTSNIQSNNNNPTSTSSGTTHHLEGTSVTNNSDGSSTRNFTYSDILGRTVKESAEIDKTGKVLKKNTTIQTNYNKLVDKAVDSQVKLNKANNERDIAVSDGNIKAIVQLDIQIQSLTETYNKARDAAQKFFTENERFVNDGQYDSKYRMQQFDDDVARNSAYSIASYNQQQANKDYKDELNRIKVYKQAAAEYARLKKLENSGGELSQNQTDFVNDYESFEKQSRATLENWKKSGIEVEKIDEALRSASKSIESINSSSQNALDKFVSNDSFRYLELLGKGTNLSNGEKDELTALKEKLNQLKNINPEQSANISGSDLENSIHNLDLMKTYSVIVTNELDQQLGKYPSLEKFTQEYYNEWENISKEIAGIDFKSLDADSLGKTINSIEEKIHAFRSKKGSETVSLASNEDIQARRTEINKLLYDSSSMSKANAKLLRELDKEYANLFDSGAPKSELKKLNADLEKVKTNIHEAGYYGKSFVVSLKESLRNAFTNGLTQYFGFNDLIRYGKEVFSTVIDLDTALIDLKKTTVMSSEDLDDFYYEANDVAKEMGVTTEEIISQAAAWSRLGYSTKEASETMAKLSSQFASISPGMDTDTAQTGLVSIMKAWDIAPDQVEREIMDNINVLGNKFAETNEDIITGMEKSASTFSALGQNWRDAFALFTGAQEVMQNAETVGTALKTLSLRIRGYDEDTEESSEDVITAVGKVADLTKTSTKGGISLFEDVDQTKYKSMVKYLGEIAERWDEIDEKSQTQLLENLFGKRGASVGSAIIENFDQVKSALSEMENAAGNADEEMKVIQDSAEYKLNALKQTWVGFAQELLNKEDIGDVLDSLIKFSESLQKLMESLTPVLSKVLNVISGLIDAFANLNDATGGFASLGVIASIIGILEKNKINTSSVLSELSKSLNKEGKTESLFDLSDLFSLDPSKIKKFLKTPVSEVFGNAKEIVKNEGSDAIEDAIEGAVENAIDNVTSNSGDLIESAATDMANDIVEDVSENALSDILEDVDLYDMLFGDAKIPTTDVGKEITENVAQDIVDSAPEYLEDIDLYDMLFDGEEIATITPEAKAAGKVLGETAAEAEAASGALGEVAAGAGNLASELVPVETAASATGLSMGALVGIIAGVVAIAAVAGVSLYKLATAQDKINQQAKEAAELYDSNITSLDDYKAKIEEQRKIVDDETKTIEEQQTARENLLDIQSQMIEQFGIEATRVDVLKDSVTELDEAFETLSNRQYQEFLNDVNDNSWDTDGFLWGLFNKENWDHLANEGRNMWEGHEDNMDSIVDQMENHTAEYLVRQKKDVDKIKEISEKNNLSAEYTQDEETGNFNIKINGNLQNYYDSLLELEKFYKNSNFSEDAKDLSKWYGEQAEQIKEDIDSISNSYNTYLENEVIFPNYEEQISELQDAMNKLHAAQISGDEDDIDEYSKKLASVYEEVYSDDSLSDSAKNWFKDLISDYQTIIDEQNFILKVHPEIDTDDSKEYEFKSKELSGLGITSGELQQRVDSSLTGHVLEQAYGETAADVINYIRRKASEEGIDTSVIIDQFEIDGAVKSGLTQELEDLLKSKGVDLSIYTEDEIDIISQFTEEQLKSVKNQKELNKLIVKTRYGLSQSLSKSGMIDALNDMSDGFDKLDEIYADIYDKDGFDFSKLSTTKFEEAFGDLGIDYDSFIETVAGHTDDIEYCQQAFNDLVKAYLEGEGILEKVTKSNAGVTKSMLEMYGVANADEIVDAALKNSEAIEKQNKKLEEADAWLLSNRTAIKKNNSELDAQIGKWEDNTEKLDEAEAADRKKIDNLLEMAQSANIDSLAIGQLEIAEIAANEADMSFDDQINSLDELLVSLNADISACSGLSAALNFKNQLEKGHGTLYDYYYGLSETEKKEYTNNLVAEAVKDSQEALKGLYTTELPEFEYTGADKTESAKDSAGKDKEMYDWLETKISRLERQITNLGKTVSATYKPWSERNAALKDEIAAVTQEIKLQETAYNTYMAKAASMPLDEKYKKLVREGGLNIEEISDEDLKQQISDYKEIYEKALDAEDKVQDLNDQMAELASTNFNNLKQEFEDLISEIEHFSNMIDKAITRVENHNKIAGKSFYQAKMDQDESQLSELRAEREALTQALADAEANGVEVGSQQWMELRNEIYSVDEAIADCENDMDELEIKMKEVAKLNFDDLAKQFENAISIITDQIDMTDSIISMIENTGHIASESYYQTMLEGSKANVTALRQEYERLNQELESAVASGDIEMYSDDWYEMNQQLTDIKSKIIDAANATIEYANALRQIKWDMFDRGVDAIGNLIDETDFMINLLSYDDLFDDDGNITKSGKATQGLLVEKYQAYVDQAKAYGDEAAKIKEELEADPKNTTLIDRYNELLSAQRQAILNSKEEEEALKELAEEGYNSLLDAIKELIDKYEEALDSAKDLYDYEQSINEKTSDINATQKQLLAYQGDNSEENKSRIQQLQAQLKEQEQDLEETEYDKYISDQKELLDDWYEDLQEWIEEKLENLDAILQEAIDATNLNGQEIDTTIHETSDEVGYTMTDEFAGIWDKFSETNSFNYDILTFTSDTTTEICTKMNDLATEAGLEEYFTGEDLQFLEKLTSVEGITTGMNEALSTANSALGQISSNVVEYSGQETNAINSGANKITDAINAKDLSVTVNVDSGGNSETSTGGGDSSGGNDSDDSSSDTGRNYYVEGYDDRGYHVLNQDLTLREAQEKADYLNSIGGSVSVHHYAKGGLITDDDNPLDIIAQSLGEDHMVAAKEGERILTPEQNEAFEKMVNSNFSPLSDDEMQKYSLLSNINGINEISEGLNSLSKVNVPEVSNTMSNMGNTTIGDVNITLPNVTKKEEFVSWLKNDGQIEKIVQTMAKTKILGGNSYNKLKY